MTDSTLVDPLNREITIHERTWIGHIIKGHPEVADYRHLVERAVAKRAKSGTVARTRVHGSFGEEPTSSPSGAM